MTARITESSGNVFVDLGFTQHEARDLVLRSELLISIKDLIASRHETQAATAKFLGITQPQVSALVNGKIQMFALDNLVDIASRLGASVKLEVTTLDAADSSQTQALDWLRPDVFFSGWAYDVKPREAVAADSKLALAA